MAIQATRSRRRASQGGRVTGTKLPRHNVAAVFPNLDAARHAIKALGRATIEADNISLTGPAADEAAVTTDTADLDFHIASLLRNRVIVGAAMGAGCGAVAGLIVGLTISAAFDSSLSFEGAWASMIFGAIGMGFIGGFIAGMYSLEPAEPWELTFEEATGPAIVGVHSEKREDVERATAVLQGEKPLSIRRTDGRGHLKTVAR